MSKWTSSNNFLCRSLTLIAILSVGVAIAGAQTTTDRTAQSAPVPAVSTSSAALFSSSADETAPAPVTEATLLPPVNFANLMQYGGGQRARYGRPRYRGNNTNEDGSNKYTFYAGAGLQQPIGNTWHYLTPSYAFQVGVGRQFSKKFAVPVEFNWDNFGFTGATLTNQTYLYNNPVVFNGQISGLDGNSHVWSFSVDPTYTVMQGEKWGAYGLIGAGFYHKTANFFVPAVVQGYDYYGYPVEYSANETIDKYTSNAPGFNAGFGLTYKISRFANERFYGEVRYVFVDNSNKTGFTVANYAQIQYTSTNLYPANSHHTTYFPIKFGIRF